MFENGNFGKAEKESRSLKWRPSKFLDRSFAPDQKIFGQPHVLAELEANE